jgi:hypothetical protein
MLLFHMKLICLWRSMILNLPLFDGLWKIVEYKTTCFFLKYVVVHNHIQLHYIYFILFFPPRFFLLVSISAVFIILTFFLFLFLHFSFLIHPCFSPTKQLRRNVTMLKKRCFSFEIRNHWSDIFLSDSETSWFPLSCTATFGDWSPLTVEKKARNCFVRT